MNKSILLRLAPSKLLVAIFLLLSVNSIAQIELPQDMVKAVYSVEQKGDEATIIATVTVRDHWHINASVLPKGSFGLATDFSLVGAKTFKSLGGIIEPKPIEKFDDAADELLAYHEGTFKLKRKIKVLSEKDFTIDGKFYFQTCNEVRCLPDYTAKFSVKVKGYKNEQGSETSEIKNSKPENTNSTIEVSNTSDNDTTHAAQALSGDKVKAVKKDESKEDDEDGSLWGIFIISFLSGFAALLTPCVFPMIPMTVSFFTKQSKTKALGIRNAIIYGLSIIIIYIILGVVVTWLFGADALNKMSTNPTFNIIFFIILVVFAISFLGAFEIRMPSKWVNKADSKADKGGLIGIFFMALALALVSFSCTGPIVGSLIVQAASEGGIAPIVGMFGFSLALAIPFALFAAFPGWLNTLPKSGGWLNSVKVVLGFLELALAFKFLSNADLALQSHLLEREVFLAIWIGIFAVLAMYLFGKIRLPHDSPLEKLSVGRALFGTTVLMFVIYMIPGMWGAPLKLINAFPPPSTYAESPLGFGGGGAVPSSHGEAVEGMHLGPQRIMVFDEYQLAADHAKKVGKPLFIDYTGFNCVNCRRMEENVWGEPGVIDILRNEVIIVSLHQDDNRPLPKEEQKVLTLDDGRTMDIVTIGDKWRAKQIQEHNTLTQPYYVFQDANGKFLANGPADYEHHGNAKDFGKWLKDGLRMYKSGK